MSARVYDTFLRICLKFCGRVYKHSTLRYVCVCVCVMIGALNSLSVNCYGSMTCREMTIYAYDVSSLFEMSLTRVDSVSQWAFYFSTLYCPDHNSADCVIQLGTESGTASLLFIFTSFLTCFTHF